MTDLERIALRVIAERVQASMLERAEREWWQDWSDADAYRRFVALLRSGRAWVGVDGSVFCQVTGPDADVWGYVASEALDNVDGLGDGWAIDAVGGRSNVYRLYRTAI